jgi:hypothetical protein
MLRTKIPDAVEYDVSIDEGWDSERKAVVEPWQPGQNSIPENQVARDLDDLAMYDPRDSVYENKEMKRRKCQAFN